MNRTRSLFLTTLMLLVLSACNMPFAAPQEAAAPDDPVGTAVAATLAADTRIALAVGQTLAAAQPVQAEGTPPPSATPSGATVTVSVDTNCRSGPGTAYPIVGALLVGQTAVVTGRSAAGDNWIIANPNGADDCWLWGQYATTSGDTAALPVIEPPPPPLPSPTVTVTVAAPAPIPPPTDFSLTVCNNFVPTVFYAYISLNTDSEWGPDRLGAATISTGSCHSWMLPIGLYDVKVEDASHSILATWFSIDLHANVTLQAGP